MNFQPLREMAEKWREFAHIAKRGERLHDARNLFECAAELDAWCDAAEAWLVEQYPYATKTRRTLLGEKKK